MRVGIDLGTTFSAIAYVDENNIPQIIPNIEGNRTTPSVVMFDGDDVCVGEQAKVNSITDPYNVCQLIKRQMGDSRFKFESESGKVFSPEDISAMILKSLKISAEQALNQKITDAVITVPAYFNDAQRKATQDAGKIAGLNVLSVINEPTAAAIAFCNSGEKQQQKVMVFDLGGGTFDVTIINISSDETINILATNGHKNLGGFDFDNEIIKMVVNEFEDQHDIDLYDDDVAMQDLRGRAELAKKTLSTRAKATISIMSSGKLVKMEITKEDFNLRIKNILNNAKTIMEIAIEDANLEWSDLDKIILVGGSTRVPAVQEMIKEASGITPSHDVHPDEAVALGAACFANSLGDVEQVALGEAPQEAPKEAPAPIKVTDVNSHSLGIITVDNEVEANLIILERNSRIPTKAEKVVYTNVDNQENVLMRVTEGEDEDVDYVTIVGVAELKLPPRPAGMPLRIVMEYDINGIIHITVIDEDANESLGEMTLDRRSNLSEKQIKDKIDRMAEIEVE